LIGLAKVLINSLGGLKINGSTKGSLTFHTVNNSPVWDESKSHTASMLCSTRSSQEKNNTKYLASLVTVYSYSSSEAHDAADFAAHKHGLSCVALLGTKQAASQHLIAVFSQ
jgi:hypothetical protein